MVWNAAIAALQFWTTDLNAHTLSNAIEEVYSAFFYTASAHTLHHQPDKILCCFMTTLNVDFEGKLPLEDAGYDRGSENLNKPTALIRTSKIHHVSSVNNASFDPDPVTPHLKLVCSWLTFSSSNDIDISEDEAPSPSTISLITPQRPNTQPATLRATLDAQVHLEEDEEEDFQTVPLDDEHWSTEEVPDRT